jgi:hypothetical protein
MVARRERERREVDCVPRAEAADRVGELGSDAPDGGDGIVDLATSRAGRGEIDSAAPRRCSIGKLEDAPIDRRSAGVGIGGGKVERAGPVEDKAARADVAPGSARAGLIGDDTRDRLDRVRDRR